MISDVFATMFFLFPELCEYDNEIPPMPETCYLASIPINDACWLFMLMGSAKLAENMAYNFMGQDQPPNDAEVIDVFKEAANVVAGNLLTRIPGCKGSLGIPRVGKAKSVRPARLDGSEGAMVFNVDGEFCMVILKDGSRGK
ncbi:MAG: chemotaxis protein CheX [Pseudomonadota bacterium]